MSIMTSTVRNTEITISNPATLPNTPTAVVSSEVLPRPFNVGGRAELVGRSSDMGLTGESVSVCSTVVTVGPPNSSSEESVCNRE